MRCISTQYPPLPPAHAGQVVDMFVYEPPAGPVPGQHAEVRACVIVRVDVRVNVYCSMCGFIF